MLFRSQMSHSSTKETDNALHNVFACQRLTANRPSILHAAKARTGILNPVTSDRFFILRVDQFTVCRLTTDTLATCITARVTWASLDLEAALIMAQHAAVNQSTLSNAAVYSITADIITADGVTAIAVDKLSNALFPGSFAESR